jgi:dCMP deaminase
MTAAETLMVQSARGSTLIDALAEVLESWPERPSWDEYFMATALLIASRSACGRLHVGCVLVSGGEHPHRIIAAGYNGFLPGAAHEPLVREGHEQGTVHAEQNAVADAARRGVSVAGATAYISHYPCLTCAKILAASGIEHVKYHFDYDNDLLVGDLLLEAGIPIGRF